MHVYVNIHLHLYIYTKECLPWNIGAKRRKKTRVLKKFIENRDLSRMLSPLGGLKCRLKYKPGDFKLGAEWLSRISPPSIGCFVWSGFVTHWVQVGQENVPQIIVCTQ